MLVQYGVDTSSIPAGSDGDTGHGDTSRGNRQADRCRHRVGDCCRVGGVAGTSVTIEIDDVASDRVERQRAFADGALPLKGTPDLGQLRARLEDKGLKLGGQLFIRIFKADSELEVWMRRGDAFVQFATYPICHWAGTIGPKLREGDKQNPEGSTRSGPGSCTASAAGRDRRQPGGFPTPSTGRTDEQGPTSWCTVAARRSAATR